MSIYSESKCWEVIGCDHFDCLARSEPDKPCWKIAKRVGAFRDVSHTCSDCIVYLLQAEEADIRRKEIEEILKNRVDIGKIGACHHTCILKTL